MHHLVGPTLRLLLPPGRRQAEDSTKHYIATLEAVEKAVDSTLETPEDLAGRFQCWCSLIVEMGTTTPADRFK